MLIFDIMMSCVSRPRVGVCVREREGKREKREMEPLSTCACVSDGARKFDKTNIIWR